MDDLEQGVTIFLGLVALVAIFVHLGRLLQVHDDQQDRLDDHSGEIEQISALAARVHKIEEDLRRLFDLIQGR